MRRHSVKKDEKGAVAYRGSAFIKSYKVKTR